MKVNKPIPFKIRKSENHALLVQIDDAQHFYNHLHYHPEFQITAIARGEGIFYAGNSMTNFEEKDVFIIGSNVPHLLKCSDLYYSNISPGVEGISLFFDEDAFGKNFFELKELQSLNTLLQNSNRVIKVTGDLKEKIFNKVISTRSIQNEELVITFLEILSLINRAKKEYLNNEQYNLILNNNEGWRLNDVLNYTFKNYNKETTIDQVSKIALLSRSQFSYFFKLHTGKTYIQFLNELRIENASHLLKKDEDTIEQICYEVGFKNVSNFVRQFKKIKATTPSQFRKSWKIK